MLRSALHCLAPQGMEFIYLAQSLIPITSPFFTFFPNLNLGKKKYKLKRNAMQTEFHPPASQLPSLSICLPYSILAPSLGSRWWGGLVSYLPRVGGEGWLHLHLIRLHVDLAKAFASKIKPSAIWVYDNGVLLKEKPFFLPLPLLW